ncbi:5-methyltetrahydropteroyltriglutamate--homocysteine S-methyltransferase [Virgibacillus halophilus]|uniref:5-methyltetrahydropteroyltriglutamate-- homocysteine S-methyltransferase n=1 Tax=Tigheibacillus halophilus TaxID=361280 RepID=UPI00362C1CE3
MTNTTITVKAPFRADQVGSLLRPKSIHRANEEYKAGKISAETLHEIQTEEIRRAVDKQIEIGLQAVTDGEFRRNWWHFDFLEQLDGVEGYVSKEGRPFKGIQTEKYNIRNTGKITFKPDHPFIRDFKEFKKIVGDRAVAKQTIPSPNQLFPAGIRNKNVYPDIEDYAKDIIQAYRDAIQSFYDAGCRYLQFDDVYLAGLSSSEMPYSDGEFTREELIELALSVVNRILEDKPADLVITTHLCRGNYRSKWAFEGGYTPIAPYIFANEKVNGFFLEYDDERSGDFEPLSYIPEGGPSIVLGVLTSKNGNLEDKETIKSRIKEASKYVPLDQLCLSTQCGFASTHHGNELTEEDQWHKLRFVVEIAKEVWG